MNRAKRARKAKLMCRNTLVEKRKLHGKPGAVRCLEMIMGPQVISAMADHIAIYAAAVGLLVLSHNALDARSIFLKLGLIIPGVLLLVYNLIAAPYRIMPQLPGITSGHRGRIGKAARIALLMALTLVMMMSYFITVGYLASVTR